MTSYSAEEIKKIASKIAKCLALAGSSNPYEAEIAKKQAEVLMQKYGLSELDVAASKVNEQSFKTSSKKMPFWIEKLSALLGYAFQCRVLRGEYMVNFYGHGTKPELAMYTYEVLLRQIKKMRRDYIKTIKPQVSLFYVRKQSSDRQELADVFCLTIVSNLQKKVRDFANFSDKEKAEIDVYIESSLGDSVRESKSKGKGIMEVVTAKKGGISIGLAIQAGYEAAGKVSLFQPMSESERFTAKLGVK